MKQTQILTRGAVLIALAAVLSVFAVFHLPNGGSVTIGSLVPIILFSLCYPTRWALLVSVTYGLLQMMLGFYAPPTEDVLSFVIVVLFDYLVAFGVLGFAGGIYRRFSLNKAAGILISTTVVCVLRFLCHFFTGILIWDVYAPEGQSVLLYSLLYNGSYMLFETIITVAILGFLSAFLLKPAFQKKLGISL